MKNKLLIVLLAITTTTMAGPYVSLQAGFGVASDMKDIKNASKTGADWEKPEVEINTYTFKMPWNVNLGLGYQMHDFRLALAFDYVITHGDKEELTEDKRLKDTIGEYLAPMFIMLNGFYDFKLGEVTPYLGLGIGYVRITRTNRYVVTNNEQIKKASANAFGYNLMAGLSYNVNNNLVFFAEYKFAVANKSEFVYPIIELKTEEKIYLPNLCLHMFNLGLRYHIA